MAEGNPILLLERGEKVQTPPALWLQGQPDIVHDYHDPDYAGPEHEPQRFVNNYRKAGGEIDLLYVDNAKKAGAGSFAPAATFFIGTLPSDRCSTVMAGPGPRRDALAATSSAVTRPPPVAT